MAMGSVGNPDLDVVGPPGPDPLVRDADSDPAPDVFGPPGSGSVIQSQRYGYVSVFGSLPFLKKVLSGLKFSCKIKF